MATSPPIQTTGRRKRAVARVRLVPGDGTMTVNGRTLEDYFPNAVHRQQLSEPFRVTETEGNWDAASPCTAEDLLVRPAPCVLESLAACSRSTQSSVTR